MQPSILIVDDEPSIVKSLTGILSDEGFNTLAAYNGYEALKLIETESPDLVMLDIWMPGIDGIDTLKEIKKDHPFLQVIIITGHGTIETAVKAIKFGAYDLIEKPLSIDKVIVAINNALNYRRLEEENRYLRKKTLEKNSITGNSPAVVALKQQIVTAAPTDSWILITGENGVGKELVARTIHQVSQRADQPMIDVNCAAIPEELIESELFGHEKGAFTGATEKKRGKFELTGNGTIFLDEVGDMSLKTQAKILRVLQERQFQRVGGSRTIRIDFRVIAASNKNLEKEIEAGRFREDLYYRLNVIPIYVPALRERIMDIPLLIQTFLKKMSRKAGKKPKEMTEAALTLLKQYAWPGNVRELKNIVERLVIMVGKGTIDVDDLPAPYNPDAGSSDQSSFANIMAIEGFKEARAAFEKSFIQNKLKQYEENITRTADAIGVDRSYLHKRLKRFTEQE